MKGQRLKFYSYVMFCCQIVGLNMCTKVLKIGMYVLLKRGWLGVAKVSCILRHRGVQLILVYSWERLAIHVAGKGTGGMFLFLLFNLFHSCNSFIYVPLFHLLSTLLSLFSLSLGDDKK